MTDITGRLCQPLSWFTAASLTARAGRASTRSSRKDGHDVTIVQNPTTSLADDVAATKRVIATHDAPVILVGHSYGGVVITEAGNDPKVAGLVYIAAFAPDKGESVSALIKDPAARRTRSTDTAAEGRLLVSGQGQVRRELRGRSRAERRPSSWPTHRSRGASRLSTA